MRAIAGEALPIADIGGIGSLRGLHNAQNAACATAAALALGLSPAAIQAGLRSFPGLAHRMEEVGRRGNVLFVNDSKATNADSAAQALVCFDDIFWIAGGKPKTGGIESLRGFFPRIRKAYLIGEAADEFAATLGGAVAHEITARSTRRSPRRRAMPRVRQRNSRSCCCRRPAPRSTSIAISRCAATRSAAWSRLCPGSRKRPADEGDAATKFAPAPDDSRQQARCLARRDAAVAAAGERKRDSFHRALLRAWRARPLADEAGRKPLHGQHRGLCLGHAIPRRIWPASAAHRMDRARLVQRVSGCPLVVIRLVGAHDRRVARFDLFDRPACARPPARDAHRLCDDAVPAFHRRQGRPVQQLSGVAGGAAADGLAVSARL